MAYQLLLSQGCGLLGYKQSERSDSTTAAPRRLRSEGPTQHTHHLKRRALPNRVILLGKMKSSFPLEHVQALLPAAFHFQY